MQNPNLTWLSSDFFPIIFNQDRNRMIMAQHFTPLLLAGPQCVWKFLIASRVSCDAGNCSLQACASMFLLYYLVPVL